MKTISKWYITLSWVCISCCLQAQSLQNETVHIQEDKLDQQLANIDSIEAVIESPNSVFIVVDQAPHFPGGAEEMLNYITLNTHLPLESEPIGEGRILVQFVVEKDGSLSDIKIIKGIRSTYDEECRRVFASMPKWCPGKKGRHFVRTLHMVPLRFS